MAVRFRTWIFVLLAILLFSAAVLIFPLLYDPDSIKIKLVDPAFCDKQQGQVEAKKLAAAEPAGSA